MLFKAQTANFAWIWEGHVGGVDGLEADEVGAWAVSNASVGVRLGRVR